MTEQFSRRDFLKLAGVGAATTAILTGCGPASRYTKREPYLLGPNPEVTAGLPENITKLTFHEADLGDGHSIKMENREYSLPLSPAYFPDTMTAIFTTAGIVEMYGSAGVNGIRLTGNKLVDVNYPEIKLGPTEHTTEQGFGGYRAFSGVIPLGGDSLAGFYHEEHWPSADTGFPFTAQIGVAISEDRGNSWTPLGPILTGDNIVPGNNNVQGVGQPCPMVTDNSIALYFTNWGEGHAKICAAKVGKADIKNPQAWKKWDGNGFNSPGLGGATQPVLTVDNGSSYAALPGVSWNTGLGKFVMSLESDKGFLVSTSKDGINWKDPQMIVEFPQSQSARQGGDTWYSYPTLFSSEKTNSSLLTTNSGLLLCSRGVWNGEPHRGVLIPWSIS